MRAAELVVASRHGYAKAVLTPAASRDGRTVSTVIEKSTRDRKIDMAADQIILSHTQP